MGEDAEPAMGAEVGAGVVEGDRPFAAGAGLLGEPGQGLVCGDLGASLRVGANSTAACRAR